MVTLVRKAFLMLLLIAELRPAYAADQVLPGVSARPAPKHTTPFRVAVIGSGVGGATAAYTLAASTSAEIHVFEQDEVLGGRTQEATLEDGSIVELGGSIGIAANRHLVHFTDVLGLKRVVPKMDASSIGIWDGQRFKFEMDGGVWSKLRAFARCARHLFASTSGISLIAVPATHLYVRLAMPSPASDLRRLKSVD